MTANRSVPFALVLLALLASLKLVFLGLYGPVFFPDSETYTRIAAEMARDPDWADRVIALGGELTFMTYRMAGYPVAIWVAQALAPDNWAVVLVLVQMALSLVATVFVYRLARALGAPVGAGYFIAFAHATSQSLLYDQAILTDSFTASLLTIAACLMALDAARGQAAGIGRALAVGVLVALALLFRESTLYLQVFLWPLLALWVFGAQSGARESTWGRKAAVIVCAAVPFILTLQAYQSWNATRTGGPAFLTSGGQTALLTPLIRVAERGTPIFDGDEPLDHAARDALVKYQGQNVPISRKYHHVNGVLSTQYGYDGFAIGELNKQRFLRAWAEHPLAMLGYSLSNFNFKQVIVQFWPTRYMDRISLYTTNEQLVPRKKDVIRAFKAGDIQPLNLLLIAVEGVLRVPAALIFAAFALATPIAVGRAVAKRVRPTPQLMTQGALWAYYWGVVAFYSLLDIELRYVLPVTPFATILGVLGCLAIYAQLAAKRRNRKQSKSPEPS